MKNKKHLCCKENTMYLKEDKPVSSVVCKECYFHFGYGYNGWLNWVKLAVWGEK